MSLIAVTPDLLRDWPLPRIGQETDKEARGRVLVIGGGVQVAGAVQLTGIAALRAGAGKLQLGVPASVAAMLAVALPEGRVFGLPQTAEGELAKEADTVIEGALKRCDAAVIGPGMLDEDHAGELALRLITAEAPAMVIDAAAMPALAREPDRVRDCRGRLVLTPHAGEMATLLNLSKDEVEADPVAAARSLASTLQAVVAMKGAVTFVVSPDGHAWRHDGGSPGLATSGSGDVLAGVIAGLLARGAAPAQAAVWGVAVHGLCGKALSARIAPIGFLARELLDEIAPVIAALET